MKPIIPPDNYEPFVQGSIKAAVAQASVKSRDLWSVPVEHLHVREGLNVRVTGTPDYEAHVGNLMALIRQHGFRTDKPITCRIAKEDGQDRFYVEDGHCRFEAVRRLKAEGVEIERLPVVAVPAGANDFDTLVTMGTTDSGKALTPFERGLLIKRAAALGKTDDEIAKAFNLTTRAVADLLAIVGLPTAIGNMIINGKVSAFTALAVYREKGKDAAEALKTGLVAAQEGAKAKGKDESAAKVSRKHLDTPKAPKAPKAAQVTEPPPASPAPDALAAIDYALTLAGDGMAWLKRWREVDADALAELADHVGSEEL